MIVTVDCANERGGFEGGETPDERVLSQQCPSFALVAAFREELHSLGKVISLLVYSENSLEVYPSSPSLRLDMLSAMNAYQLDW